MNLVEKFKGFMNKEGEYEFPIVEKYFACWDSVGKSYVGLFSATSTNKALQIFESAANSEKTEIGQRPENYRLDQLFEIELRSGKILNNDIKKIAEAKDYKNV